MGLPIAKAIVEAHGGTISLTSQRGQGPYFPLHFPSIIVTRCMYDLCDGSDR